jgi:hypothetical protein
VAEDPGRRRLAWGTVRAGLGLLVVGVLVKAAGLETSLLLLIGRPEEPFPGTGRLVLGYLSWLAGMAGGILALAGMCLGCAAPGSPGPRRWAVISAACLGVVVLLAVATMLCTFENLRAEHANRDRPGSDLASGKDGPPYGPTMLKSIRYVSEGVGWLQGALFLLFLAGVARSFRRPGLAAHALVYLGVFLLVGVASVVLHLVRQDPSRVPADVQQGLLLPSWFLLTIVLSGIAGSRSEPPFVFAELPETLQWAVVGTTAAMLVWFAILAASVRRAVTRGRSS